MTTTTQTPLNADFLQAQFDAGKTYDEYVASGDVHQQQSFKAIYDQITLTDAQRALVESFTREQPIVISSGVWCGDCVQQVPLVARIAEANPDKVKLRIVDRDEHAELAAHLKICGGMRVPVSVMMAEDFELVSIFGDRTLTRYRAIAARSLGAACSIPGAPVPTDELAGTLQDWLDEIERVQLVLRLSTRLRNKHGD